MPMTHPPLIMIVAGFGAAALAQSNSSSASYDLLHAPPGGGGGAVGNGSTITAEISVGDGPSGPVSNATAMGVQVKPNYIGQLYDVTTVTPEASPATVDEGSTRQLSATALLDDLTTLTLAASDVNWSVTLGPLTGIDSAGLATADLVYEDTAATAEGTYQGVSGQVVLTILDVIPDNFGAYAGDGLDDGWQVEFFGPPPNTDAAPNADPDMDRYNNAFELLTGYDPTDPKSFFQVRITDRTGTTSTLELSKVIPGTRYRIERSADLGQADPWTEFTDFTTPGEVFDHEVSDPNAVGTSWFYQVRVEPE